MPKITDGYKPKSNFNVSETSLFYNLHPNKTVTYKGDSCHSGTKSKRGSLFCKVATLMVLRNYLHW
jgi:hypothetical protein